MRRTFHKAEIPLTENNSKEGSKIYLHSKRPASIPANGVKNMPRAVKIDINHFISPFLSPNSLNIRGKAGDSLAIPITARMVIPRIQNNFLLTINMDKLRIDFTLINPTLSNKLKSKDFYTGSAQEDIEHKVKILKKAT
jgi:hypothetical protein